MYDVLSPHELHMRLFVWQHSIYRFDLANKTTIETIGSRHSNNAVEVVAHLDGLEAQTTDGMGNPVA